MFNFRRFLGLEFYVSGLDDFLIHFRRTHNQLNTAQRQEVKKHTHIQTLRDQAIPQPSTQTIWDKF